MNLPIHHLALALALATLTLALLPSLSMSQEAHPPIRIGMIGLDTSHATAFTEIFHDPDHPGHVPGAQVVAAFKAASPDIPSSIDRVDGYTQELVDRWGVELKGSLDELAASVDAVMVESVDGRPHLEQARAAILAGKPVFIDKPMAGSLADAIAIFKLAREHDVPCWSASNLRFHPGVVEVAAADIGPVSAVISYGPSPIEPNHPDLFFYGIHAVEALFTVLGPGCLSVSRSHTEGTDVVTGIWEGGRTGVMLGLRDAKGVFGIRAFGQKDSIERPAGAAYPQLLEAVIACFQTGQPPVSPQETLEIHAFMEAADISKEQGGTPVNIPDLLKKHGWE
jgi:predicted dehydrogenase